MTTKARTLRLHYRMSTEIWLFHWFHYIFLVSFIENRQILGDANGVDNLLQALAVSHFFFLSQSVCN